MSSKGNFDTRLQPNCRNFDRYARRKKIAKPHIVGYYSCDQNRQFIPDHSKCAYIKLPPSDQPIHFDLNEGYDTVQRKPAHAHNEKLDHILQFILLNWKKLRAGPECGGKFLNFDIICFRGKIRMLMCTPYSFRDGWSLLATKWKGNIYLCESKTDEERMKEETETPEQKKFCAYGRKFEQFLMSDDPTSEPNTNRPVMEAEEFCCMFTTKFEGTTILYGAEMDGIESAGEFTDTDVNDLTFVELKVRMKPSNQRQMDNFYRFKTINWWCQSHLANVQKIVVGLRNQAGIVDALETMDVESLPKMSERYWSATICMEFLDKFFGMVKQMMQGIDCPQTVYKFDFDPKVSSSIQCQRLNGPNDYTFLPDWYINDVQKLHSN